MAVYAKLPDGNYAAFPDDWDADRIDKTLRKDHPDLFAPKKSLINRVGESLPRPSMRDIGVQPTELQPLPKRPLIDPNMDPKKARLLATAGMPVSEAVPSAPGIFDTMGFRPPLEREDRDSAMMEVQAQKLRKQELEARGMDPRQAAAAADQVGSRYLRERGIGAPVSGPERFVKDAVSGAGQVVKGNMDFVALMKNDPNFARQERESLGLALRELMPADPGVADEIAAGTGSVVGSLGPGFALAKTLQTAAALSPRFAYWAGAFQSGALESAPQAGQIYQDLADSGVPLSEAQQRALAVFVADFATAATTDRMGLFNSGGVARKWVGSSAGQGVQEGEQSMAEDMAMGRPVDYEKALRSAGIGMAAGALGSGPLVAVDAATSPKAQAKREAGLTAERFSQFMDKAVDTAARRAFNPPQRGTPLQPDQISPVTLHGVARSAQPTEPVKYRKNLRPVSQDTLDRERMEDQPTAQYPGPGLQRGKSQRSQDEDAAYAEREQIAAREKEIDTLMADWQKADQEQAQADLLQQIRDKAKTLPGPMQAAWDRVIGGMVAERDAGNQSQLIGEPDNLVSHQERSEARENGLSIGDEYALSPQYRQDDYNEYGPERRAFEQVREISNVLNVADDPLKMAVSQAGKEGGEITEMPEVGGNLKQALEKAKDEMGRKVSYGPYTLDGDARGWEVYAGQDHVASFGQDELAARTFLNLASLEAENPSPVKTPTLDKLRQDMVDRAPWKGSRQEFIGSAVGNEAAIRGEQHRLEVRRALGRGEQVPESVLNDYPDLQESAKLVGDKVQSHIATRMTPEWAKRGVSMIKHKVAYRAIESANPEKYSAKLNGKLFKAAKYSPIPVSSWAGLTVEMSTTGEEPFIADVIDQLSSNNMPVNEILENVNSVGVLRGESKPLGLHVGVAESGGGGSIVALSEDIIKDAYRTKDVATSLQMAYTLAHELTHVIDAPGYTESSPLFSASVGGDGFLHMGPVLESMRTAFANNIPGLSEELKYPFAYIESVESMAMLRDLGETTVISEGRYVVIAKQIERQIKLIQSEAFAQLGGLYYTLGASEDGMQLLRDSMPEAIEFFEEINDAIKRSGINSPEIRRAFQANDSASSDAGVQQRRADLKDDVGASVRGAGERVVDPGRKGKRPSERKGKLLSDAKFRRDPRVTKLAEAEPRLTRVLPYLTPEERAKLRSNTVESLVNIFEAMPDSAEMASVAFSGRAKRGWYDHSAEALHDVFGADTPRFAALLAALSPQTSVENNTINALKVWTGWVRAGRPTDESSIIRIMGENVQGNKGEDSVLDAWKNNALRALQAEDPTTITLSGPKVNSFMLNLQKRSIEVTNDAWMANYALIDQEIFSGSINKTGTDPGKTPGYLGMSAAVRRAADILSKRTGETWTPAEIQETVWSWAKTLYELREAAGENRPAPEILKSGDLHHDAIGATPDFAILFTQGIYRRILEEGGYHEHLERVEGRNRERRGSDGRGGQPQSAEGSGVAPRTFERHLEAAAERIERLYQQRQGAKSGDVHSTITAIRDRYSRVLAGSSVGGSPKGIPGPYGRGNSGDVGGLSVTGRKYTPKPFITKSLENAGVSAPTFFELDQTPESAEVFFNAISESKIDNRFGSSVHVYSTEEYQGMRLFITEDGMAGFALKGDDIVSVFSTPGSPHTKSAYSMVLLAVQEGGRRLDAFDTVLPRIYSHLGFRAVARMKWSDEFAPEGWDKATYSKFNNGEPDVVFMAYDPGKASLYKKGSGKLTEDYDEAVRLQDAAVGKKSRSRGVKLYANPFEPVAEAYTQVADRAIELWNDAIGYRWHVLGKLPQQDEYQSARYRAMAKIEMADNIAKNVYAAFRNAGDPKQIYDYLTTVGASPTMISDMAARRKAVAVKKLIDKVGRGLVDRGLIPQEAYEKFKDQYLPRIYLRHVLGDDVVRALGTGKKANLGWMKNRKDIPEEIRHLILGEIRDAAFLAGASLGTTLRDIAIMDFLELISENDKWVFGDSIVKWKGRNVSVHWMRSEIERIEAQAAYYSDQERQKALAITKNMRAIVDQKQSAMGKLSKDFVRVPDSRRYGHLAGAYIRKEIYDDLMSTSMITGDVNALQSLFESGGVGTKITQYFKWAKVAANPPSHFRNIASNMILVHLSGVPMARIPDLMIKSILQIKNNGTYYRIAKKNGLVSSTFSSQELPDIQRDTIDFLSRQQGASPLIHIQNIAAGIAEKFGDVYQAEEMFGKLIKLMYEMENGVPEKKAVAEAQKWLFDYSQVPPLVRWARNAPSGVPFLTFYYKALPRIAEAMVRRPWAFLPYIVLPKIMAAIVAEMYDVDDEDVKKLAKSMPSYMEDKGHALLWPYKDQYGRWRVIDFSYLLPWGMFTEMRNNVGDSEFGSLLNTSGLLGGPVADIASAVKTNIDPFSGKPIIDDRDPAPQQITALLTYMYDMFAPTWLTSKGALKRIADAHAGTVNPKTGDMPLDTTDAWWRMLGINIYPFDPESSRERNIMYKGYEIKDVARRMREQMRMAVTSGATDKEMDKIEENYTSRINAMLDELSSYEEGSRVHPNLR